MVETTTFYYFNQLPKSIRDIINYTNIGKEIQVTTIWQLFKAFEFNETKLKDWLLTQLKEIT